MATHVHPAPSSYHLPRIRGWDVSGVMAQTVAADYQRLVDLFGLEPPGAPFTVYVEPGVGGPTYQAGSPTTFYIGAAGPAPASRMSVGMIEVFAAAVGPGWEDQTTPGTALRYALVTTLHPDLAPLMLGLIHGWWHHGASDYLTTRSSDDPDATGCGLLFLAYLHAGLGHSWPAIVRAGGPTLAATYATLTGADTGQAYPRFLWALQPFVDARGVLALPEYGSPWRIEQPAGGVQRRRPWV
jgi:hypothetical protein